MAVISPNNFSVIDGNHRPALSAAELNSSLYSDNTFYDRFNSCILSESQLYFKDSVEILTTFLGFPANLRVLWILLWARMERSTSDLYTGSLAVMDAMYCVCLLIDVMTSYISTGSSDPMYIMEFFVCLNELGVPPLLACICLDRYVAVLHPTTFMRLRDNKLRILTTMVIWSCALSYAIHIFIDYLNNLISYYIDFTVFIVCFLLIIFCNLSLLKALMDSGPVARDSMHPVKKKAFITVLIIFIIITVSFLPDVMIYVYVIFGFENDIFLCLIPSCFALFILRTAFQPLFFLYHARKLPFMSSTNPSSVSCCRS